MGGEDREAGGRVVTAGWLAERLASAPRRRRTLLVGLDGRGGSGKTTLARALAAASPEISVVSIDDFYLPPERLPATLDARPSATEDTDLDRLERQVLRPLEGDTPSRYQRWDWARERLAEWRRIEVGGVVVMEGVAIIRKELRDRWDLRAWVSCPRDVRLARGLRRDGESSRETWERHWLPAGDRYESEHRPAACAELVVDGAGRAGRDPRRSVVVLRAPTSWG